MSILPPELRLHLLIEVGPDWPREGVLHQGHDGARHVHALGVQPHRRLPQVVQQRDEEPRSEEHTSELQSQSNLVCRLLLEKKNKYNHIYLITSYLIRPSYAMEVVINDKSFIN